MKKRFFLFGAVAALAMGGALTACSDDAIDEGNNKVAEVDQTRYLHVSIANPPSDGSRAASFEPGTALENYVHEMYFVFYDSEGRVTGEPYSVIRSLTGDNPGDTESGTGFDPASGNPDPNGHEGNVGKFWTSTVAVDLEQGDNLPAYVCVFINPVDFSQLRYKSLSELDAEVRMSGRLSDEHFPMSNSVYYDDNPISGATNVRLTATPITSTQLYPTQAEAANSPAIDIYVERYASKVKLNLSAGNIKNTTATVTVKDEQGTSHTLTYEPIKGYTLKFVPQYFRVNAIDRNSFVMKRYGVWSDNRDIDYNPSYAKLNELMKSSWWNDKDNHRSYWAASPAYYMNNYPRVSDDVTDKGYSISTDGNRTVTITEQLKNNYGVYYFTYNMVSSLTNQNGNISPTIEFNTTNGFNNAFYANETTVAARAWGYSDEKATQQQNYNPLAALPSAIIVGHYEVTKDGESTPLTLDNGFWLFGKTSVEIAEGNIKTNVAQWDLYETELAVKTEMSRVQNVVLKNIGTDAAPEYRAVTIGGTDGNDVAADVFVVKHPDQEVRIYADKSVAGRLEALQLSGENLTGLYWYDAKEEETGSDGGVTYGKYEPIDNNNLIQVNAALLTSGYATHYGAITNASGTTVSGLAYFSIPIEHRGIYVDDNGTHITGYKDANGLYNFKICPPGSFGLVRNHSYTIDVNGISGLATALRDGDQPIVPPLDVISYYINAKVNILNWRILPTQMVTL